MRRLFVAICLILFLGGCERDNVVVGFPVDKSDFTIGYEGEEFTVNFDILPSMQTDAQISITQLDGTNDWIELVSSNMRSATFVVKRNLQNFERHAQIKIKNKSYAEYTTINVTQKCLDPDLFNFEINEITTSSFNVSVTAKDEDLYIVGFMAKLPSSRKMEDRPFDNLLEDGSLFSANFGWSWVSYANRNGLDLKQTMIDGGICGQGSVELKGQQLEPGREYCLFVAGVEFNKRPEAPFGGEYFEAITYISNLYFELEPTPIREDIHLEARVEIDPAYPSDALFSIDCNEDSGLLYRVHIFNSEEHSEYIFEEHPIEELYDFYSNLWYEEYSDSLTNGIESLEAFLAENTFFESIDNQRLRLKANGEHCLVVFALDVVDDSIQVVSLPEIVRFRTGECEMADTSFEYTQNELHGRMVDFTITPSNELDGYYATLISKQEYDSWDKELLHQRLVDEGWASGSVYFGANDFEFRFLNPETDYYVACVGVHGGVATTEGITLFPITTPIQAEPKCKITGVDYYGPFSAGALYYYNPQKYHMNGKWMDYYYAGYCAVGVDIHTEGEVYQLYARFYADEEVEGYDDNQIIAMLQGRDCMPKIYYYCKENIDLYYYVAAMDEDGNIDLYKFPDVYNFAKENYITDEASIAELAAFYDEVSAQHEATRATTQPETRAADSGMVCIPVIY